MATLKTLWALYFYPFCSHAHPNADDAARVYQLEDLGDGIGGPKALARPGDYVLENGHVRFAILGALILWSRDLWGLAD